MPEIKVLPKAVSELIAAGEVVERPASVIKELVENSIDAGSTLITVEIKNGGVTFMRVTDNGCGIARNDVATAFLRHATSKVKDENDLNAIATLGFRGEALAAISSVSRIEMLTKQKSDAIGTLYTAEGAGGVSVNDAGCPDGTTIIVRDLFFNTPARMKFLKKDIAEGTAVGAVLDHIALSHPEISFRFIRDGKNVFSTPGDGKLESAVYAVCGREFASSLIPVNGELGGIRVNGFVCRPSACRPKKNAQFVFLNGRYVRSGTVSQALEVAYKNSAMVGRYPAAVLHLTVPYGAVDINVHPAKTEVRFSDERRIFDCVMFSVKNAIASKDRRPEMSLPKNHGQIRMTAEEYRQTVLPGIENKKGDPLAAYAEMISGAVDRSKTKMFRESGAGAGYVMNVPAAGNLPTAVGGGTDRFSKSGSQSEISTVNSRAESASGVSESGEDFGAYADINTNTGVDTAVTDTVFSEIAGKTENGTKNLRGEQPSASSSVKTAQNAPESMESEQIPPPADDREQPEELVEYIGEAFATYIIVRKGESLFLIDKHAAHERILFNKLRSAEKNSPQMLLSPEQVVLRGEDYTSVTENFGLLEQAGFEIEDFGDNTVLVRAVPSVLSGEDVKSIVYEVAANLASKRTVEVSRLERIYETMSCRAAVKAGNLSSKEELAALAKAVLSSREIMYCPHGRPVAIELKKREIEKQFGRIQ